MRVLHKTVEPPPAPPPCPMDESSVVSCSLLCLRFTAAWDAIPLGNQARYSHHFVNLRAVATANLITLQLQDQNNGSLNPFSLRITPELPCYCSSTGLSRLLEIHVRYYFCCSAVEYYS